MKHQNLIHQGVDYFGIAYYGFLALYALYELFFGSRYPALLVIAPLIYALVILAILRFFISGLYAISALRKWSKKLLREAAWHFVISHISLGITAILVLFYVHPNEWVSLIEPSVWFFIFFVVADILLRILLHQPSGDTDKEGWIAKLRQASSSYPIGSITLAILFIGGHILMSLLSFRLDLKPATKLFSVWLIYSIFLFIYDTLNRWLGETLLETSPSAASDPSLFRPPRPEPEGGLLPFLISIGFSAGSVIFLMEPLYQKWIGKYVRKPFEENSISKQSPGRDERKWQSILFSTDPSPHRWSHGVTVLLAILSTTLPFLVIGVFLSDASIIRLFILSFSGIYGLLAWIRWREAKELGKEAEALL